MMILPKRRDNPDFSLLIEKADKFYSAVNDGTDTEEDLKELEIQASAFLMEALYGEQFWDWYDFKVYSSK